MDNGVINRTGNIIKANHLEMSLCDYITYSELERTHGSSFYLLDINKLKENYRKIENAFKSRYENFIIGYSYKTNYLPFLCKQLSKMGAYAEVVSRLEYDLAIKIGVDSKNIIFNGPLKSKEDIEYALDNGSMINLDSNYEIGFVKEYCLKNKTKKIKIGLRVNFDISENGTSPHQEGYETSRFGFCVENGTFLLAINEINIVENIKIVGLHGHFSTSNRGVDSYKKICQGLCNLAKENLLEDLEYIDVGGGIYGEIPESFKIATPSFDEYAEAICTIINDEFDGFEKKPILILEPGMSMVANTFIFIAKVIEVKKIRDENFVLVDGSVHNIKPTMHKRNLPMKIIDQNDNCKDYGMYNIVGYTCMEKDYLAHRIEGEIPKVNDYVIFENVGAYTIVFNPPFIKERPSILAFDNDEIFTVRKKETIDHFFSEDLYCF